ncbi:MAG: hypothetical protein RKP46_00995 [Candidatus Accumulibacter sp.]|uniref:hypothetical protein n=1 Tax=Accumulibacter sp. TaxID=2053492 RepID=UPI00287983D5|nr:hypothetical protein [Accumulibacter sp.]MDS4012913.1 hypothetical protein [Accumulibacter sp.]
MTAQLYEVVAVAGGGEPGEEVAERDAGCVGEALGDQAAAAAHWSASIQLQKLVGQMIEPARYRPMHGGTQNACDGNRCSGND